MPQVTAVDDLFGTHKPRRLVEADLGRVIDSG